MLYEPSRHEPLVPVDWDADAAVRAVERIVRDAEARFSPDSLWPLHPRDAEGGRGGPDFDLYGGAAGVVWTLHHLQAVGAVQLARSYAGHVDAVLALDRARRRSRGGGDADAASYLAGDTGILLLGHWLRPSPETAARLAALIEDNVDHPARELMLGAPGTMLAAVFLHERTGEARWADLFAQGARTLWSRLEQSAELECRYWTQELFGHRAAYLGGVHGFASAVAPIVRGRHLLEPRKWDEWRRCIVATVRATAMREDGMVNWPPELPFGNGRALAQKKLMQFCHGAPGVVCCLADLPDRDLDDDLVAAGEAIWAAESPAKGSNLCHGTGGNGYAFLKLWSRTGDERWLARARAFAMHGIAQTEAQAREYGQMRYSLWTGDAGFAVYLWDCVRAKPAFPTLDVFFA